jgi:hypothetical protein
MTPIEFYKKNTKDRVEEVSRKAGTNLANFKQIVFGGSVSRHLAKRLSDASGGEMTRDEILYQSEYIVRTKKQR